MTPSTHRTLSGEPRSSINPQPRALTRPAFSSRTDAEDTRSTEVGTPKLVADRGDDEQAPVQREDGERYHEIVPIPRPERELRRADQKRAQGEPAPALPEEHGNRGDQRDDHEREGDSEFDVSPPTSTGEANAPRRARAATNCDLHRTAIVAPTAPTSAATRRPASSPTTPFTAVA